MFNPSSSNCSTNEPRYKRIVNAKNDMRRLITRQRTVKSPPEKRAFRDDTTELHQRLGDFFNWLSTSREIIPDLARETQLAKTLKNLSENLDSLPTSLRQQLEDVRKFLEDKNWNTEQEDDLADNTEDSNLLDDEGESHKDLLQGIRNIALHERRESVDAKTEVLLPPEDHPIWGIDGIMHGLAIKKSNRIGCVINKKYAHEKQDCKFSGDMHNGRKLQLGKWFPRQMKALFDGYHGVSVGGIHSDLKYGAFSIVVAALYDTFNDDQGDIVYYPGPESLHDKNTRETPRPESQYTQALRKNWKAYEMGQYRPVRVLRAEGNGAHAPSVGLRYDGLYQVVGVREKTNAFGGPYQEFKLRRVEEQTSLAELSGSHPSAKEVQEFDQIGDLFEPEKIVPWDEWESFSSLG